MRPRASKNDLVLSVKMLTTGDQAGQNCVFLSRRGGWMRSLGTIPYSGDVDYDKEQLEELLRGEEAMEFLVRAVMDDVYNREPR